MSDAVPKDAFLQALVDLGITEDSVRPCRTAPTFEDGKRMLEELKAAARAAYRRLALELHPDRTGGDREMSDRFRAIVAAWKQVQQLKLQPPAPPPAMIVFGFSGSSVTASTTSSSTYGGWGRW